jgi:cytoskeletal protein CcmA (bactofilin family)
MSLFNRERSQQDGSGNWALSTAAPVVEEKPAPRASKPAPAAAGDRSYLDKGLRVTGKLSCEGAARIDGQVDGEITGKETIVIGETALVTAQIKADSVVVAGKVNGDITATRRLELHPSARVVGNLASPILVIHEGAILEGRCTRQPETAREDDKAAAFPKEERLAQAGGHKQA